MCTHMNLNHTLYITKYLDFSGVDLQTSWCVSGEGSHDPGLYPVTAHTPIPPSPGAT